MIFCLLKLNMLCIMRLIRHMTYHEIHKHRRGMKVTITIITEETRALILAQPGGGSSNLDLLKDLSYFEVEKILKYGNNAETNSSSSCDIVRKSPIMKLVHLSDDDYDDNDERDYTSSADFEWCPSYDDFEDKYIDYSKVDLEDLKAEVARTQIN